MAGGARTEKPLITGPAGAIEALLEYPDAPRDGRLAIVCHPHPLFGGTMQNKVVHTLARVARDLGVPSLRFNFRGVGASDGVHDNGVGESADAIEIADWARREIGSTRIWAMGFSFGSYVAFQLAAARAAERLVTIAPPVQRFDFSLLPPPACPWLVVQGDADELVNHESVLAWTRALERPPEVQVMPGVDHFFHGRLTPLRAAVATWLGGPAPA